MEVLMNGVNIGILRAFGTVALLTCCASGETTITGNEDCTHQCPRCNSIDQGGFGGREDTGLQDLASIDFIDSSPPAEATQCLPLCEGIQCGSDGCDGDCGVCEPGMVCAAGVCVPGGALCDDGNETVWDGCTNGEVSEFNIDAPENAAAEYPHAVAIGEGRYVIAWVRKKSTDSAFEVVGCSLTAGSTCAKRTTLSEDGDWNRSYPQVAHLGEQSLVVVWQSNEQDGDGQGVYARLFDYQLEPLSSEFQVPDAVSGNQAHPSVATMPDGRFVVVWSDGEPDKSSTQAGGLRARVFGPDGSAHGNSWNVYKDNEHQYSSSVTVLKDRIAVFWAQMNWTNYLWDFQFREFDLTGVALNSPIPLFQMVPTGLPPVDLVSTPAGLYAFAFGYSESGPGPAAQVISVFWAPDDSFSRWANYASASMSDGGHPSICATGSGVALTWMGEPTGPHGPSDLTIHVSFMEEPKMVLGTQVEIMNRMPSVGELPGRPSIACLDNDEVVVVWTWYHDWAPIPGVYVQRLTHDGAKLYL